MGCPYGLKNIVVNGELNIYRICVGVYYRIIRGNCFSSGKQYIGLIVIENNRNDHWDV